jgi:phosphodiesterase/alkaline phosphatase D-like protein
MRATRHDGFARSRVALLTLLAALGLALALPALAHAEEEPPQVLIQSATGVSRTSAVVNALVNPNNAPIEECEFEYGTSPTSLNLTVPCSELPEAGEDFVQVSAVLKNLTESTKYYYRVVAVSEFGEAVSTDKSFTTLPTKPQVTVTGVGQVTASAANLKGLVNPNASNVEQCEFEWATSPAFESPGKAACSVLPGSGEKQVKVSARATGLSKHTVYYVRLSATNAQGQNVSQSLKFATPPSKPSVVTQNASEVGHTSVTLNASVNPNGSTVETCEFEYGTSILFGSHALCESAPGSGEAFVSVSAHVTGLSESTTFYYRIVAINEFGPAIGGHPKFTTLPSPPKAVTLTPTKVTTNSAQLNANVNPNGLAVSVCEFEYGTTLAYGSKAPCESLPGSGESGVPVAAQVSGLKASTTYDYRIVAVNMQGASYGQNAKLTTPPEGQKPVVTKVSQKKGPAAGKAKVKIKGTGFTTATEVMFGSVPAASFKVESDTLIVAITPAEPAGTVNVVVTNPLGTSEETVNDLYRFK